MNSLIEDTEIATNAHLMSTEALENLKKLEERLVKQEAGLKE